MDGAEEKVSVGLSKREIRESPGIEADTPVSRQNEIALADHFRWPRYWETLSTGEPMLPLIPPLPREPAAVPPTAADVEIPRGDPSSEERRVGKECVSTCSSGWSQSH